MNKIDLIQALKDSNHLSRSEAETFVNLFFDKIADALEKGDRVEIRGLCSFFVKKYSGYTGRNPKTGEKVKIAPKKLPFFKVGRSQGSGGWLMVLTYRYLKLKGTENSINHHICNTLLTRNYCNYRPW